MLLKKAAGIARAAVRRIRTRSARSRAQLEEIANAKMKDLNANDMDAAVRIIAGSARSMGLEVEGL